MFIYFYLFIIYDSFLSKPIKVIPEECFVRIARTPAIHDKFVGVQACNPSVTSITKLDFASNTE